MDEVHIAINKLVDILAHVVETNAKSTLSRQVHGGRLIDLTSMINNYRKNVSKTISLNNGTTADIFTVDFSDNNGFFVGIRNDSLTKNPYRRFYFIFDNEFHVWKIHCFYGAGRNYEVEAKIALMTDSKIQYTERKNHINDPEVYHEFDNFPSLMKFFTTAYPFCDAFNGVDII